jgi:hypothetical protein
LVSYEYTKDTTTKHMTPAPAPATLAGTDSLPPVTAAERSAVVFFGRSKKAHIGVCQVGRGLGVVWWGSWLSGR